METRGRALLTVGLTVLISVIALWACAAFAGASFSTVVSTMIHEALGRRTALLATCGEFAAIAFCGLAVLVPYRAGFFNIGAQGQLEVGGLAAVTVALWLGNDPWLAVPAALLASCLAGMVAAVPPLLLKLKRGANEVTTSIMMNFTCLMLVYAIITGPLKDPTAFYGATRAIPEASRLPTLPPGGPHLGFWLALVLIAVLWVILGRTVFGTRLRAVGSNRRAAVLAGINVNAVTVTAVLMGAAMAGLTGGVQLLGLTFRVAENWTKGWGFTGIPVALLGGGPIGVLIVSAIFAVLETGSRGMQALTGVPAAVVYLLQGIPVLVYLALRSAGPRTKKPGPGESSAASGLGEAG
jgi:simple sugar transport system permease protein